MIKYCPFCGKTELVRVGLRSSGAISVIRDLRCVSCKKKFIVVFPVNFGG